MKRKRVEPKPLKSTKRQKVSAPAKSLPLFAARRKQGPEKKNIDTVNTQNLAFGSAAFGVLIPINIVAQGASAETRVGRKIVNTSLDFNWTVSLGTTSTGGGNVRILVVYDKQTNAALPVVADVLAAGNFLAPMNLANSERFVVIASIITEPVSANNNFAVSGKFYRKMLLETVFNDTNAGNIGDIQTGGIYFLVAQDGFIGTANGLFSYYTRIRFEDA